MQRMPGIMGAFTGGGVGAPARTNATAQAERFDELVAGMHARHLEITKLIAAQTALLARIHQQLAGMERRGDVDTVVSVSTLPVTISKAGRRHLLVWSAAAQAVHVDMGTGDTTLNLAVGWTVLDAPESARVWLASGTPVNLLFRATDDVAPGLV